MTKRKDDSGTDMMAQLRDKLREARVAFDDDSKNDHTALGLVLEILEAQAGIEPVAEDQAAEAEPAQTA